jgi:hypothetical protein
VAARKPKKPQSPKDLTAGTQPTVRTYTTWTPDLIRSAEIAADTGNLRQAANLCDWILADDRVSGTLQSRTQALLGLVPTFEASGDKRRSNRAVKALDAQEDWWAAYPEAELELMLAWGIVLGVAPERHGWVAHEDHGNRVLPCPEFWHPQHLRQDQRSRKWWMRIASESSPGGWQEVEIVAGDGTWILHTPYGRNRPWSRGAWRALARLVLLKTYAVTDWQRHSEKSSLHVVTVQEGIEDNKPRRQELAQDLYARGANGVVCLPPGFDLKLVEATANTKAIYDAQIEMANTAIAVLIRGGNLTTEVGKGGSRAAANTQERLGDQAKLRFDSESLSTTIHDQSLVWWSEFNFGDRKLAPWPVYPTGPKKDVKAKADVAAVAADVVQKFETQGFEVDRQKFAEEFELTEWLKPGEKPETPPPVPPGQPGQTVPPTPNDPKGDDKKPGGADGEDENDDQEEDDDEPEDHSHGPHRFFLASGDRAPGFLSGQLYTDALVERALEAAGTSIDETIVAIEEEMDAASDYDDLRARLRTRYASLNPEQINAILFSVMSLGDLAGRASVNEDA